MKILLCYNKYPSVSGETTFFNNMKAALAQKGFEPQVCAVPRVLGAFEYYSRFPMLLNAYQRLKKFKSYDLVHFLNAALAPAGRAVRKPKIGTSHFFAESYLELSPPKGSFSRFMESVYCRYVSFLDKQVFRELDCLVACTDYQSKCIRESYSVEKIRTIYPGVDADQFRDTPKTDLKSQYGTENVIVYLGRLHERSKGVSYAIRAMDHLDNTKLLVVGDGPDRRLYERMAGDNVIFLGYLEWEKKCSIQKSADAVVMPSLYEVFGTVFAESMACEVPVVAFDMPFWKGLYDGAGIFAQKNSASLAQCLEIALTDKNTRKKVISKGREYMEKYDINKTISDYIALYEELAGS